MSANWELQLISAVVRDNSSPENYITATEEGITTKMFGNAEARALWSGIEYHFNRPELYGHIPSETLLKERYGDIALPTPVECMDDLCRLVQNKYIERQASSAINDYSYAVKEDPRAALSDLYASIAGIQETSLQATDKDFTELALSETVDELDSLEETSGVMGMPFPWDKLNEATGGIHAGDFILVYALPKSMKTWLGLVIAVHLARTGRNVLIYSKEMMWENVRRRVACILGQVDYRRYRKNELSSQEKARLVESLDWFQDECSGNIHFTAADKSDGTAGGPVEIRRKIEVYRPHFVLLDSAYMLELSGNNNPYDWKSMALVNRQLKQIAKTTGIPLLAILQENERAAFKYKGTRGTASLAMNTSAVQDCDLSIRCVYNKSRSELSLHLPAARETTDDGFTIYAHAAENFGYAHDRLWEIGEEAESTDRPAESSTAIQATIDQFESMVDSYRRGDEGDGNA